MTDQPQADYRDSVAQTDIGDTNRVQGNTAECSETSVVQRYVLRYARYQITTRDNRFGVPSPFAPIRDAVAKFQIGDGPVFLDDDVRAGVARAAYSLNLA